MSKQVWARRCGAVLSLTDGGIPLQGGDAQSGAAEGTKSQFPATGTIDKLTITIDSAVAASATKVFTLNINGSDTALTGTINAGQTQVVCTGGPISVTAGDLVYIKYAHTGTPGASANAQVSWLFNGVSSGESVYMGSEQALTSTTPRFFGVFPPGNAASTSTANDVTTIAAAAGTITKMYCGIIAAAGTTGSYKFTIFKNGVAQDGTGGTPDTRLTITNVTTRVNQSVSFSLPVAVGDLLYIQCDAISTPSSKTGNISILFVATNPGESIFGWPLPSIPGTSGGASNFNGPYNGFGEGFTWGSEANRLVNVADKFKLYGMQFWLATAPGATKSRTFESRKNSASGNQTLTISGTSTTGSDLVHQDNFSALDQICHFESATANTPTASIGAVAFIQFVQGGNAPGKGQQGNKKNAGGAVNISTPGGTQLMFTNLGISAVSN